MSADAKAKSNHERLDAALDRLTGALESWQDAFELLQGQDLTNDALIAELISRMYYSSAALNRNAEWLRKFGRHRMN